MIRIEEQGTARAAGFDDPIGLLEACHARIAAHCMTLGKLARHLQDSGDPAMAREAATRVLHYFDTAGPLHHADEEADLRPLLQTRLEACGDEATLRRLDALMNEHAALADAYGPLRAALARIVAGAAVSGLPIEPYVGLMRRHFTEENDLLFVRARALLSPADLRVLGAAMARRRGVQAGAVS